MKILLQYDEQIKSYGMKNKENFVCPHGPFLQARSQILFLNVGGVVLVTSENISSSASSDTQEWKYHLASTSPKEYSRTLEVCE